MLDIYYDIILHQILNLFTNSDATIMKQEQEKIVVTKLCVTISKQINLIACFIVDLVEVVVNIVFAIDN